MFNYSEYYFDDGYTLNFDKIRIIFVAICSIFGGNAKHPFSVFQNPVDNKVNNNLLLGWL